ncbi:hypothetical protein PIB30_022115 [Stylosanthes scabra]|uniref:Uncharacterized protein n=1 Tax=Stylosanthes scabra TaxID=79078 RepID=A0ABU6T8T7_9FABA|nr:hypothetical protein [Stylosanthes scabra]
MIQFHFLVHVQCFTKIITVSLGLRGVIGLELGLRQQRTIGSSKCLWGLCFHVEQRLTSRLTVAAGGPPAIVPATNLVLVLDRSGLAMITDRVRTWSFVLTPYFEVLLGLSSESDLESVDWCLLELS